MSRKVPPVPKKSPPKPPRVSIRKTKGQLPSHLKDFVRSSKPSDLNLATIMDPPLNPLNPPNPPSSETNSDLRQMIVQMQSQIATLSKGLEESQAEVQREREARIEMETVHSNPDLSHSNFTPGQSRSATPLSTINSTATPMRKLYDLPLFSGKPEQWPAYIGAYKESTEAYSYSKLENLFRVQKSLSGEAREAVQSLLIHPNDVDAAIETLEFRYGRPDVLINSQIQIVRQIPPIANENRLDMIMSYASKVQNLAKFLDTPKTQHHLSNYILIEELVQKLPLNRRYEWAEHSENLQPYPTLKDLSVWVNKIAKYMNMATMSSSASSQSSFVHSQPRAKQQPISADNRNNRHKNNTLLLNMESRSVPNANAVACVFCSKDDHQIRDCNAFKRLCIADRWDEVKKRLLCFSCLKRGHRTTVCRARRYCNLNGCKATHNPLLHEDTQAERSTSNFIDSTTAERRPNPFSRPPPESAEPSTSKAVLNCHSQPAPSELFFRVVPVTLINAGKIVKTYALLDEGSSISLLDEDVANDLELSGRITDLRLDWFGDKHSSEPSRTVSLQIKGASDDIFELHGVRTVRNISLPTQTIDAHKLHKRYKHLINVPFAEMTNAKPKILIGLDHSHLGAARETICEEAGAPVVVNTKLGWVVYGPVFNNIIMSTDQATVLHCDNSTLEQLNQTVREYFTTENFGVCATSPPLVSSVHTRAQQILESTTVRIGTDRFQTGLLWSTDDIRLPDSRSMALNRLTSIERKMKRDAEYAKAYEENINHYINMGYARSLTTDELSDQQSERVWYLPHFSVKNPNKPGKLRLVFDAAAAVDGKSLNDVLLTGPDLNKPLLHILFHFRIGAVAVCGDIREMYHQILIRPEDQHSQRFLWRHGDPSQPIQTYVMRAMTFGSTCSPCSAQYVKNLNAEEHREHYPEAVDAIIGHHYVDDYVMSFKTSEEAIRITRDVVNIHSKGGFELRNFSSNRPEVLTSIGSISNEYDMNMQLNTKTSEKILGMYWETNLDTFSFRLQFNRVNPAIVAHEKIPSKREVLSLAMSIFDPFGFLANFTLYAKCLFQELWKIGLDWDEPIPLASFDKWKQWLDVLPNVRNCHIPRCYSPQMSDSLDVQLHIFADASESAFAAVAYWRVLRSDGQIDVAFIMGKTRCAPPKLLSIPRLELQAAVLATRLSNCIRTSHQNRISRIQMWTDSKTVVQWVRSDSRRYKPFVAHRIAEILESTTVCNWRWLPTTENVADDATRVRYPPQFDSYSRWLTGPVFLKEPEEEWPIEAVEQSETQEEIRPHFTNLHIVVPVQIIDINRFSSYLKLKRTMAWVKRFVLNLKFKYKSENLIQGEINVDELNRAELELCQMVQRNSFAHEYNALENRQSIDRSSPLYSLSAYLDEDKTIRIGGRIDSASSVQYNTKRPIILPKCHYLTDLIVQHFHRSMKHQNENSIICAIREMFWIPNIRAAVRRAAKSCFVCKIISSKPKTPQMGQLPIDRLTPFIRPFTFTGLDYFGPVYVTVGRRREKRWVALFTCLTIRAVHLEIAADLSTDACILCLMNFINIRGTPKRIRSDNGTNFIGANREWKNSINALDQSRIQRELSSKGVEWKFNVPSNPSAGGCWERMVRSIKRVLSITLNETAPKVETLRSLLIEAGNIVNSRPLTYVPIDSIEEEPLTPNHFLIGVSNSNDLPSEDDSRLLCHRKQWRVQQQYVQSFWRRWIREYLPDLTRRTKWHEKTKPLEVNDLVLICDETQPSGKWRRGIIQSVFPGSDGQIRSALVRTSDGELRRPTSKLAILDMRLKEESSQR